MMTIQNQTTLQLDPTYARQAHVANQAGCIAHPARIQEILGRGKSSGSVAEQPQKMSCGFANRLVVLDDGYINLRQVEFPLATMPRCDNAPRGYRRQIRRKRPPMPLSSRIG